LDYFVGKWILKGEIRESVLGPAGSLNGTQNNAWSPDKTAVNATWEENRPSGSDAGRASYAYDRALDSYTYHSVSNSNETEDSRGTMAGDTWTWLSDINMPDDSPGKGRYVAKMTSSTTYTFSFDIFKDGEWSRIIDGTAVKNK
jgi:hypothetical protein